MDLYNWLIIQIGRNNTQIDLTNEYFKMIIEILSNTEKNNMNLPIEMESIAFYKYSKIDEKIEKEENLFTKENSNK